MKKIIKSIFIVVINIFIFLMLFIMLDYSFSLYQYKKQYENVKNGTIGKEKTKLEFFKKNIYTGFKYWKFNKHFTSDFNFTDNYKGENKNKGAVILFGCSFAYGAFLGENQNFSAKLSKLTGRTVFNRAMPSYGLGQMLWLTKQTEFYNNIEKINEGEKPDYVIYVYIPDHFMRSCRYKYGISNPYYNNYYLSYDIKDGKLIETKPFLVELNKFTIFFNLTNNLKCNKNHYDKGDYNNFEYIKLHFEHSREELRKRYPDIKFIIIKYPYNYGDLPDKMSQEYYNMSVYSSKRWKELQEEGFIIIEADKQTIGVNLNDEKYKLPDNHPNEAAWDIITPVIVKIADL